MNTTHTSPKAQERGQNCAHTPRRYPKVIAYGIGFAHPDYGYSHFSHPVCYQEHVTKAGMYRLSVGSHFHPGAENEQLVDQKCHVCGKGWPRT